MTHLHPHVDIFNLPAQVDSISDICIEASNTFLNQYKLVNSDGTRNIKKVDEFFLHHFDGLISFYSPALRKRYNPYEKDMQFDSILEFCQKVIEKTYKNPVLLFKNDLSFKVNNLPLRINVSKTINGDLISVRIHPEKSPFLEELAMPWGMYEMLCLNVENNGGLIIVAAENGQGKSTTLAATLNSILLKHGGLGITIEDPVELNLHGMVGDNGRIIQTEITNTRTIDEAASDAARQFPTSGGGILMIGEIRDPQTAALAMKFANRGILVITTIHASTPRGMVSSLLNNIAEAPGQNIKLARESLANSLRFLICQRLEKPNPHYKSTSQWDKRFINGDILFNPVGNKNIKLMNAINNDELIGLNDIISNQRNRLNICKNNYTKGKAAITHQPITNLSEEEIILRNKIFCEDFLKYIN